MLRCRHGQSTAPDRRRQRSALDRYKPAGRKAMDDDFSAMSDPDFLAERRRVREELEHTPEHSADRDKLIEVYADLDAEFIRRARSAWQAS